MRFKCASSVRVALSLFCSFPTCGIIASKRVSGMALRVIHVLCVPVFCLHPCFWMHGLRYPRYVCSFQLQKDRFWAKAEDKPQSSNNNDEDGGS